MNTKIIKLDINTELLETITAKQGDTKSRFILFNLYDGAIPFDLSGRTVRVYGQKKDNTTVFNDLEINDAKNGYCTLELTNQMLAVEGMYELELVIFEGDKRLSTMPFILNVIGSKYSDDAIMSTNEFTALSNALQGVGDVSNKADKQEVDKLRDMITGLSKVATSGLYSDLIGTPTKLSQFINDIGSGGGSGYTLPIASSTTLGGVKIGANLSIDSNGVLSATNSGNGSNITISNTLDNYSGATLSDKMVAMFNDINTNHKNTPMVITLPSGVVEVTQDLTAIGWTNKIFRGECILYFKNCNGIEFKQCQHNDIYIHRVSSQIPQGESNPQGFINPSDVANLTKRGIKITDCSYNKFEFNTILGFTNAIEIYSEYGALGTFYNNIYFTAIWRCQRAMWFRTGKASDDTSSQSGWITEIFVHGGMLDCDDGVLIGQEVNQRPANEPSDNYQGLKFYNIGVEHIRKKQAGRGFYFLQGKNNAIINPRFEGSLNGGNSTSGAYILVEESGYACNNRIETSNYPLNVDRVKLNHLAKQLANPNYDNPAGSYIEGDLYDNGGFRCGYKAIATPGKMVYEAKNLSNYYLQNAKINTFNYVYSDTEFAKVKCSDGTIKTIGYTS